MKNYFFAPSRLVFQESHGGKRTEHDKFQGAAKQLLGASEKIINSTGKLADPFLKVANVPLEILDKTLDKQPRARWLEGATEKLEGKLLRRVEQLNSDKEKLEAGRLMHFLDILRSDPNILVNHVVASIKLDPRFEKNRAEYRNLIMLRAISDQKQSFDGQMQLLDFRVSLSELMGDDFPFEGEIDALDFYHSTGDTRYKILLDLIDRAL